MKTLKELSANTYESKINHVYILLNKAKEKKAANDNEMQQVHYARLMCILTAYFEKNIPENISSEIQSIFSSKETKPKTFDEKRFIQLYEKARIRIIENEDTHLYDIVDKEFRCFRYDRWRKKERCNEWKEVVKKKKYR